MANQESTAVNELIDLMQGPKPMQSGSDDLMFSPPKSTKVTPPRMTGPTPTLRGTGEVAPLPRAPSGTSQLSVRQPVIRVTTAPPTRNSIPPLPPSAHTLPEAGAAPQAPQKAGPPLPRPSRPSLPPARTQQPASSPVAAPFAASASVVAAPFAASASVSSPAATHNKDPHPFAALPVVTDRPPIDAPGDVVYADHWFEASRGIDLVDDLQLGTHPVPKKVKNLDLVKKLVAPMLGLVLIGVCVGGFFAFNGEGGKKAHAAKAPVVAAANAPTAPAAAPASAEPAPVAEAKPEVANEAQPAAVEPAKPEAAPDVKVAAAASAPATQSVTEPIKATPPVEAVAMAATTPTVREVQTTRGAVKLVDIRIDSKPMGATVMLVDNGKTSFLGSTPISASVDPARSYDVILMLEGRPTQMSHFDPTKTQRLDIELGKAVPQAAVKAAAPPPAQVETPAAVPAKHHHHDAKPAAALATTETKPEAKLKAETRVEKAAPKKVAVADSKASGVLMISSKPPCKIFVDGKDTGLSTPQRTLALPAGPHKITLVNAQQNVNKTVSVQITADQSTKLIQDLMAK